MLRYERNRKTILHNSFSSLHSSIIQEAKVKTKVLRNEIQKQQKMISLSETYKKCHEREENVNTVIKI